MKKLLIYFLLFLPMSGIAQVKPAFKWSGEVHKWKIEPDGRRVQTSQKNTAGQAYISTPNPKGNDFVWDFNIEIPRQPTGGNYMRVYLMSDNPDLSQSLKGYVLILGEASRTDPKKIQLCRQDGASYKIHQISSETLKYNMTSQNKLKITVMRTADGVWSLTGNLNNKDFKENGTWTDKNFTEPGYFGVFTTSWQRDSHKYVLRNLTITAKGAIEKPDPKPEPKITPDPEPKITPDPENSFIWTGQTDRWEAKNDVLQSKFQTNSGPSYITTTNPKGNAFRWAFKVKLGFAPSPFSQLKIYLMSNKPDLSSALNGYFLQIGEKGIQDGLHLYRQTGSATPKKIISSESIPRIDPNSFEADVIVTRNEIGEWDMKAVVDGTETNIGSVTDKTHTEAGYFGLLAKYSASTSNKFSLSKLQITAENKTEPAENALIGKGALLINELLFNPHANEPAFLEIYNSSNQVIDLQAVEIVVSNASKQVKKKISEKSFLLDPLSYLVLTESPEIVQGRYPTHDPKAFLTLKLPTLNRKEGIIELLDKEQVIDRFNYNENMHFRLLNSFKGVSLERNSLNNPHSAGYFLSATSSSGYGTPGKQNSQFKEALSVTDNFTFSSPIISPNNDGRDDVLTIGYSLDQPDYAANITVFDDQGRIIRRLYNNQSLASQGELIWDGLNDQGKRARQGIHIVFIKIYNAQGKTQQWKKAITVVGSAL